MPEWWEQCPAEEVVDYFVQSLYSPQYPSASVVMHITDEETLAKVRAVILRAEVADKWAQQTLRHVAARPTQDHYLRMPHDALKANPEVFASVIRQLIGLGVVREIEHNYASGFFG